MNCLLYYHHQLTKTMFVFYSPPLLQPQRNTISPVGSVEQHQHVGQILISICEDTVDIVHSDVTFATRGLSRREIFKLIYVFIPARNPTSVIGVINVSVSKEPWKGIWSFTFLGLSKKPSFDIMLDSPVFFFGSLALPTLVDSCPFLEVMLYPIFQSGHTMAV
jgi:hypothetical protein